MPLDHVENGENLEHPAHQEDLENVVKEDQLVHLVSLAEMDLLDHKENEVLRVKVVLLEPLD